MSYFCWIQGKPSQRLHWIPNIFVSFVCIFFRCSGSDGPLLSRRIGLDKGKRLVAVGGTVLEEFSEKNS